MNAIISKGQFYKNWKEEIYEIVKVSPTARLLTAKNTDTNENAVFRFYNASCKYIKEGTPNTELGELVEN